MAKTDITRQKIKSKISAIKKINDDKKSLINNTYDAYKDRLESTEGAVKKSINDFTSKIKGGTENKKDIFGEILDTVEGFIGTDKEDPINPKAKPIVKTKILRYSKDAISKTLQTSNQIINDEVKKSFFGGSGICNSNTTLTSPSIKLSPKAFDFVNMLKVDPDSTSGKLMYEDSSIGAYGNIKFNKTLYEQFDAVDPYTFITKDNTGLFSMTWDAGTQEYSITPTPMNISSFLNGYYNAIEYPNVDEIFKNAMLMTLQGDGTESTAFNDGMKYLNRLCTKLLSVCGSPTNEQPLLNNTPQQLTEDETDIQNYFDFDDVEGIDLDDEDAKLRRVLKFRDCNNFEVPINSNHMEDFSYLSDKKNIDENVFNTLNKAAIDAYEQSNSNIPFDLFQLSLTTAYIAQIPKALVSSILSPKMFFPIALVYKELKGSNLNARELMKSLYNLFFNIVKEIYWKFIKEFWSFIKRDILSFVKETATQIMANKVKKIKSIISSLISFLTKAPQIGIGSCTDIFNAILNTLTSAMNKRVNVPMPGMLLAFADKTLPGYSADRAYMNVIERMESAGINMGPIYGTENKLPSVIKAILDGHSEEMDTNSYVSVSLHTTTIPANGTNAYIISGLVSGGGKLF
jgi:hypothetical protein